MPNYGKRRGFSLFVLATPLRGRAIPFHFITSSSQTIRQEATSRNMNHFHALQGLKELIGEKPSALDREFSYWEFLLNLVAEGVHFVIRLNLGSNPPLFYHQEGKRVELAVSQGQQMGYAGVRYKGQVPVNVIGCWERDFREPLWIMTDLPPEQALSIYQQRMKIEESFRNMKSLMGIHRATNKSRRYLEQVMASVMIAYAIGLLIGEKLRDHLSSNAKRWKYYSGLFLLLHQPIRFSADDLEQALLDALGIFTTSCLCLVPTHV